jgi:hypothetical protein
VTIADWAQTGRFIANVDAISEGSEFQRADSAPGATKGDGRLTVADWVLAGRYAGRRSNPQSRLVVHPYLVGGNRKRTGDQDLQETPVASRWFLPLRGGAGSTDDQGPSGSLCARS